MKSKTAIDERVAEDLAKALFEFDLDGMIARLKGTIVPEKMPAEIFDVLADMIHIVGPKIFESGFIAGCEAGVGIADDIHRQKLV